MKITLTLASLIGKQEKFRESKFREFITLLLQRVNYQIFLIYERKDGLIKKNSSFISHNYFLIRGYYVIGRLFCTIFLPNRVRKFEKFISKETTLL